ncbi:Uu.00g112390.m01.CDS01 [Anthostomella pinea]|uniref:Uu.00g112390.m01.CDS01 n=1 Tax=Anthostomella pinea TaxID=933095 RepID=A0AAI8VFA4_9PEZI|nr:Uu.00g112390.m01.CDS01 [Anthostomella pinea]
MQDLDALILPQAPPLDPAWLAWEAEANLRAPKPALSPIERQPLYAAQCRALHAKMMAPGAPYHDLSVGIRTSELSVPSSEDGYSIPVLRYELEEPERGNASNPAGRTVKIEDEDEAEESAARQADPEVGARTETAIDDDVVMIYYHGGGLTVGEADSEDLSCRQLIKYWYNTTQDPPSPPHRIVLYSIGYRLKPQHPARVCVADALSAYTHTRSLHSSTSSRTTTKTIIVGSSSGGLLATLVSQAAPRGTVHGILLRCPVTSDAWPAAGDLTSVPARLRYMHTSASASFETVLLSLPSPSSSSSPSPAPSPRSPSISPPGNNPTRAPRDALPSTPLELPEPKWTGLPRAWIQVCTNDVLYSEGLCYASALQQHNAGVEVQLDVVRGWPHTFWLKYPHLARAREADEAMVRGLRWLLA